MTKPTYDFARRPKRFDDNYANDGVWFHLDDEAGLEWPDIKLALVDPSSDRFIETIERLQDQALASAPKKGFRQPAKLNKREQTEKEIEMMYSNFIEVSMVDWDVKDSKGKPIPFSKDAARAYFDPKDQDARFHMKHCIEFASNVANYQPDGQVEKPEGN